jgi:phage tail-like protein
MRGTVPGLSSPYPLGEFLPAVFQEHDQYTMRWTEALDEVLAPLILALDCITAYIDPLLAPEDFLQWLSGWSGVLLDENWPVDRRRSLAAAAVGLYRSRGTVSGLRAHLELVTGGQVEITDNGRVTCSRTPNGDLPGEPAPVLTVRVTVADQAEVNARALEALIRATKPAHVLHRLEVVVA